MRKFRIERMKDKSAPPPIRGNNNKTRAENEASRLAIQKEIRALAEPGQSFKVFGLTVFRVRGYINSYFNNACCPNIFDTSTRRIETPEGEAHVQVWRVER